MAIRVSTPRTAKHLVSARTVEWLPPLTALAYVVTVVWKFRALVRPLYWNTDAASPFVIAKLLPAHGAVEIPRFGWWTSLWWLLATRDLPGHEHLWEATGYAFALATAVVLGWATSQVAGRWAGVTSAAVAVVVGPATLMALLTVNFHTSTPFTAAVLAAYLVLLPRTPSWLLVVAVGVLAGANAASDPLLFVAGVGPFAVGAAVLAFATKRRDVATRAAAMLGVTVVSAAVTDVVMRGFGFHVIPVGLEPVHLGDVVTNFIQLGKSIALVFGAQHFFPGVYPSQPFRYAITFLTWAALAAVVVAAVRFGVRRSDPTVWAYACYWATTALAVSVAYWLSNLGSGGGPTGGLNYMLSLAPAAGVGAVLLAARSARGRIAVALAICAVGSVNAYDVADGRAEVHFGAEVHGAEIIRLLEREGLSHGYGPYWDAPSLTWKSGMRLLIAPVGACSQGRALCRNFFFTMDSWYYERPGPSFLIVDPPQGLDTKPPPALGQPSATYRIGSDVTVYVYPYDIGRHVRWRR